MQDGLVVAEDSGVDLVEEAKKVAIEKDGLVAEDSGVDLVEGMKKAAIEMPAATVAGIAANQGILQGNAHSQGLPGKEEREVICVVDAISLAIFLATVRRK